MKYIPVIFLFLFVLILGFIGPINLDSDTLPDLVAKTLPAIVEVRPGFERWLGAGVLISDDGWVATAKHMVTGQEVMIVTTLGGNKYMSTTIITDPNSDIATLKIDAEDMPHVKMCETYPRLGAPVYTIGHPLRVFNSVSRGIVSNIHISMFPFGSDLIMTDAELTFGNSGGGLFNMNGCLLGVVVGASGCDVEMNLVVPIARGKKLYDDYMEQQKTPADCNDLELSAL